MIINFSRRCLSIENSPRVHFFLRLRASALRVLLIYPCVTPATLRAENPIFYALPVQVIVIDHLSCTHDEAMALSPTNGIPQSPEHPYPESQACSTSRP